MKKHLVPIIITILSVFQTLSAGVDDVLSFISKENAEGYLRPLATSLGLGLNSGLYHTAAVSEKFSFGMSLRASVMLIPDDHKRFNPSTPDGYVSGTTSTIFGGDPGYSYGSGGYVSYPGGFNVDHLPLAFPQITLGYKGFELTSKFIPKQEIGEDKSEFYFYSFALKHELSRYFKLLPVHAAVQIGTGKIKFSEQLEFNNMVFNGIVSKKFGVATLYGGLGYQLTTVDVNYTTTGDPDNADPSLHESKDISLNIRGDNGAGVTFGTMIKLAYFVFNFDYTYNSQSVLSTGLSIEF